eukprot:8331897-Pyramimonas_sp.AAC.1
MSPNSVQHALVSSRITHAGYMTPLLCMARVVARGACPQGPLRGGLAEGLKAAYLADGETNNRNVQRMGGAHRD